jgi:hypothetical protein
MLSQKEDGYMKTTNYGDIRSLNGDLERERERERERESIAPLMG